MLKEGSTEREIEAVFFDAGETLIHPVPSFVQLFLSTCARFGFHPGEERVVRLVDDLMGEVEERQEKGFTFTTSPGESRDFWLSFYGELLKGLGMPEEGMVLAEELYHTFSDPGNYRLYHDVLPALEQLRCDGYVLGIISNFEPWLIDLLEMLGVRGYFQVLSVSGLVGVEKPHRAIFQKALEMAGVEPDRALHVGDSLKADVSGAAGAGINPVLLDRKGRHIRPPCPSLRDLRELPRMLSEGAL